MTAHDNNSNSPAPEGTPPTGAPVPPSDFAVPPLAPPLVTPPAAPHGTPAPVNPYVPTQYAPTHYVPPTSYMQPAAPPASQHAQPAPPAGGFPASTPPPPAAPVAGGHVGLGLPPQTNHTVPPPVAPYAVAPGGPATPGTFDATASHMPSDGTAARPRRWVIPTAIIAGALLVVGVVVLGVTWLMGVAVRPEALPPAVPTPAVSAPAIAVDPEPATSARPVDPVEEPVDENSDSDMNYGPDDPVIDGTGTLGDRLDAMRSSYLTANSDGSLWEKLPDTAENRVAFAAFMYILSDLKVATIWGFDADTAYQYERHAKHVELLFLDQKPLGTSVKITLEDKVFTYDGDTGEGGFTDRE